MTVEQLQSRIATLETIQASGVLRTRYGDRDTEFRSMAEVNDALSQLRSQLAAATTPRSKQFVGVTCKGF